MIYGEDSDLSERSESEREREMKLLDLSEKRVRQVIHFFGFLISLCSMIPVIERFSYYSFKYSLEFAISSYKNLLCLYVRDILINP